MPLLSREFLEQLGIQLDDQNYAALSDHFETTLYERVVAEIGEELTPEQAAELASLQSADDATIQQWLTANVPEVQDIVADEIDILLGDIAENSEEIAG